MRPRTSPNPYSGLLALALGLSAGIHAALVPEHLREMPTLGYLFIVAAAVGTAIAVAVVVRPNDARIPRGALLFLVTQIICWVAFITLHIPGFMATPEPVEAIALVCKATELLGVILALRLAFGDLSGERRITRARLGSLFSRG